MSSSNTSTDESSTEKPFNGQNSTENPSNDRPDDGQPYRPSTRRTANVGDVGKRFHCLGGKTPKAFIQLLESNSVYLATVEQAIFDFGEAVKDGKGQHIPMYQRRRGRFKDCIVAYCGACDVVSSDKTSCGKGLRVLPIRSSIDPIGERCVS